MRGSITWTSKSLLWSLEMDQHHVAAVMFVSVVLLLATLGLLVWSQQR